MRTTAIALLLLCACGQPASDATEPVVVGTHRIQPASVVSYVGRTADSAPVAQLWISDQTGYCGQVATMDPCHANFFAGEGPLAGTYLHLGAFGTVPGTYAIPGQASAQLVVVTGTFLVTRLSATSGSIVFSTLDAQGASGTYQLTFSDGSTSSGRFQANGCAAFGALYDNMRLPQYRPSASNTTSLSSCSSSTTCNSRTRSVSCTVASGTSWTCQCTREDGSTNSCSVTAAAPDTGCSAVPESCCVVGF